MMESIRQFHVMMFYGVMCVVLTMAQDCPYNERICSCGSHITCYDLQIIPPLNTGVNVSKVASLVFENGDIASIYNNSLPANLTEIQLLEHPLNNIADDAFESSAATLQVLYIKGAKFSSLPKALQKLTNLTQLSIVDTPIQHWDTVTLKSIAASIQRLDLSNESLPSWPTWISDFYLLHTLDLSLNPLNSIPDNAFNNLNNSLMHLYLSGTGLTNVPTAVSILTNLTTLDLSDNNFTDTSEFANITGSNLSESLSDLNLNSDGLTRMPNFSNLLSLDSIILSNNRISDAPAGSLPSSLTSLYFLNNSLSSVPKDVASMPRLSILDLSYNVITGIETNSLPPSLTYLRLDINNVTIITNTTFRNLNLLSTLDLSFNPISKISTAAFSDLVSLEVLNLLGSHLTEIPLSLTRLNPDIHLYFTTTEPLSCPCPAPQELLQWATAVGTPTVFQYYCDNGQKAKNYLSGQCGQSLATVLHERFVGQSF